MFEQKQGKFPLFKGKFKQKQGKFPLFRGMFGQKGEKSLFCRTI